MASVFGLHAAQVRVATFNIKLGLDGTASGAEYQATKAVLARVDADVVAFQELKRGSEQLWKDMAAELGYEHAFMVVANDQRAGSIFLGYYSRFPTNSAPVSVDSPPGASEMARLPLRASFRVPGAAKPLVVWNTHQKSGGSDGDQFRRAIEAYRTVQDIDAYRAANPAHDEFLLLGDLNQDYTRTDQVDFFYSQPSGLVSSYVLGSDITFPVAYNVFPDDRYTQAGGGLHRLDAFQQGSTDPTTFPNAGILDYIFVSTALRDSPLGAPQVEVYNSVRDSATGGAGLPKAGAVLPASTSATASDHLVVFADIDMRDAAPAQFSVSDGIFASSALLGGPFDVPQKVYTVTNNKAEQLDWYVSVGAGWLDVSPAAGSIPPGGQVDVTVSLNAQSLTLPAGGHDDQLFFTDQDAGSTVVREVALQVIDEPFVVVSPGTAVSTNSASFLFEGAMRGDMVSGLTWSNRASGQTGTIAYSSRWSADIPMAIGTNVVDFRGLVAVTNMVTRASDSPTDPAYASGWFDQSNGGSGFGPWDLYADWGFAGHILYGADVFNVPPSFGGAFSIWASGNGLSTAQRSFDRQLTTNDTFRLQFDNNAIDPLKSVGFALADEFGAKRLDFFFVGGEFHYRVEDAAGNRVTDLPYTADGMDISVQFEENDGYRIVAGTNVLTGTLASGGPISSLVASNNGSGANTAYDLYLGAMSVEDSSGVWAYDSPTNSSYGGVWTNGSQGGTGFGAWQLTASAPDGWAGHARFDTNVWNVPPEFGGAFSLWASGGGFSQAWRPFTQAMETNDAFVVQFDNNLIEADKSVAFALADADGVSRFYFMCYGGYPNYWIYDAEAFRETTLPVTEDGFEVRVELTSETTYRVTAGTNVVTGTLIDGGPISQLQAYNDGSGGGTAYDFYLGSMRLESASITNETALVTGSAVVRLDVEELTDGLPNSWWIEYFGTVEGASASADSDGDGFSNAQEYAMGTDPTDFASALRMDAPLVSSGQISIAWDGVEGKTYQVKGKTELLSEGWQSMGDPVTATTTGKQTWTHTTGAARHFYSVELVDATNSSTRNMITVQGGTLPESSQLAGIAVSTFQIGKYEVTWDEWQEVRDWAVTNGYIDLAGVGAGSAGDHPVRGVNWYDVVKWMNAKSEKEGLVPVYQVNGVVYRTGDAAPTLQAEVNGYRLPKDAEWEWAARGGVLSQGYVYSGSDDVNAVAWYADNSSGSAVDLSAGRGTWPVGQKVANELGIYDMSGNVSEWCEEVVYHRGGSWINSSGLAAVADRRSSSRGPTLRVTSLGFRVARNAP